jgi:glycosyltransferase involved in cell wall biosynthesis
VAAYLQHSQWANDVYVPYFGDRCVVWPVGVDTDRWQSVPGAARPVDFLVYDKIPWERERMSRELVDPIMRTLERRGYTTRTLRYGEYAPGDYAAALTQSKAMLFLSPHESQGLAYQEALSSGVPVLAWDPGRLQDPNRFAWGAENVPTSSVPYFDARCGVRFRNAGEFEEALANFEDALARGAFAPREFVLERLTLERCAQHYLSILEAAQVSTAAGRRAAVRV